MSALTDASFVASLAEGRGRAEQHPPAVTGGRSWCDSRKRGANNASTAQGVYLYSLKNMDLLETQSGIQ